jgi:Ca2+-binding EF-hand superfamily protein
MATMELSKEELQSLHSKFMAASKGQSAIYQEQFKEITLQLIKDQGSKDIPSEKDIDAAFSMVDEDRSGTVDFSEFVMLFRLVKCGDVKGLSKRKSMFTSSKKGAFMKNLKLSREKTDQDIQDMLSVNTPAHITDQETVAVPATSADPSTPRSISDCFEIRGAIGKGALSTVLEGKSLQSGQRVAVKITPKDLLQSHEKEHIKNEVMCLKICENSRNVLKFVDFFEGTFLLLFVFPFVDQFCLTLHKQNFFILCDHRFGVVQFGN